MTHKAQIARVAILHFIPDLCSAAFQCFVKLLGMDRSSDKTLICVKEVTSIDPCGKQKHPMILLYRDLEFVNLPRIEVSKSCVVSSAGLGHSDAVLMSPFSHTAVPEFDADSVSECRVVVLVAILHIIRSSVAVYRSSWRPYHTCRLRV
jgi:hypothetical protein